MKQIKDKELIDIDIKRVMEYTSEILRDASVGKAYTSTIKTCECLLWVIKDLESLTRE